MPTNESQQPLLLPEGLGDPEGHIGFFAAGAGAISAIAATGAIGAIAAIDLATGSLLWQTDAAEKPLLVLGKRLAAQAPVPGRPNALQVVLLDLDKGEPVLTSEPIVLPDWVDTRSRKEETFRCRARRDGNALILSWEAHRRYSGGAAPSPQVLRQAGQDAAGAVRIDLGTGHVEEAPSEPAGALPETTSLRESDAPPSSPDVVWQTEPWQAGGRVASLALKQESTGLSLSLETRRAGAFESAPGRPERVELARGAALAPSLSCDGHYVLVEPDEPGQGERTWWIHETATGRRIATVPHEEGSREPCLAGQRLLYIVQEPSRPAPGVAFHTVLKCRDLGSGALLWERPLTPVQTARPPALPQ